MTKPLLACKVTVEIEPHLSLQELAKVFSGLVGLEKQNLVSLRLRPHHTSTMSSSPRVLRMVVNYRDAPSVSIAIDLMDQSEQYCYRSLMSVDFYFKRSLALGSAPYSPRAVILPFGLNNPAISRNAAFRLLRARRNTGVSLAQLIDDVRKILVLPHPEAFHRSYEESAPERVLYQVRLWPEETRLERELNNSRIELIRALRQWFGGRFIGGVVRTQFACEKWPSLLTTWPQAMRKYPSVVKSALVGVNTHGLHGSTGFKIAEYLAASCCIVSNPLSFYSPKDLVQEVNYLSFDSIEKCLLCCDFLLSNPKIANEMRRKNWELYKSSVEATAQMRELLLSILPVPPER